MRRFRVACTAACASGVMTPTTGTASSSCSRGSAAEVDEVLVRHRHETLVEDGQASNTGVEHAHWPRVHGGHRKGALAFVSVGRTRVAVLVAVGVLACAGTASAVLAA